MQDRVLAEHDHLEGVVAGDGDVHPFREELSYRRKARKQSDFQFRQLIMRKSCKRSWVQIFTFETVFQTLFIWIKVWKTLIRWKL